MQNKLEKIARRIASSDEFDFLSNNKCGPDNMIEVAKSEVFAYQLSNEDIEKIKGMESREGEYDESYKVAGNWICTADVSSDAGEFWIVKKGKFSQNYEEDVCDDVTMTKNVCGFNFKFGHHLARSGNSFNCFRIPLDAPKSMSYKGQKFVPGDYVFIEDGECSEWARSAKFMQSQYVKINDGDNPSKKICEQYDEIIDSGK